jgi:phosphatidylglycerol:prolipoprotein diacylglycerol transferase
VRPLSRRPTLASASGVLEVTSFTGLGLQHLEPRALGVTYWFDAAPDGDPYSVTVRVTGRLRGEAPPGARDTFTALATVDRVIPGSGRVALTTRVADIPSGAWDVVATPVHRAPGNSSTWLPVAERRLPVARASGTTAFEPVVRVRAPGVRLGAWPALVGTGAALALLIQIVLAPRLELSVQRLVPLSLAACVLGLLGAKLYYLATHPRERRSLLTPGMAVQGFVIVAVATVLVGAPLLGLSWTATLDSMAPGLLLGMAVGRLGCLFGGCCAGRPTSSRWGVWSSDRRVGVRRVPVQLLESSFAGTLAALALLGVFHFGIGGAGLVLVAGLASYIAGRQVLFPLRDIPRATRHGRVATLATASVITLGAMAGLLTGMG